MGNEVIQYKSEMDNCIYFYDEAVKHWRKICDLKSPNELPMDVRKQVRDAQNRAEYILRQPLTEVK